MTVPAADQRYTRILNESLGVFFGDAVKATLRDPTQAAFFLRTVRWQKRAARTRETFARQGLHVPPILLFSITNRCNLHCRGCYHRALRGEAGPELTAAQVRRVVGEAQDVGISFVVLAGGEPLIRPETMEITAAHPEILFLVFTNGLLIDEGVIETLQRQRNVVPVISMEGYQPDTDGRRGTGVSARLEQTIASLKKAHIFWGTSVTVTRTNHPTVTTETFVGALNRLGCKLFFFVEYSPVTPGTEEWVIDETQRLAMAGSMASFREQFSALFVSVPGDEDKFGGCLAAGRGFVHVSADGNVEPCPFVPYSDANLKQVPLKTALQSSFLAAVRNKPDRLEEGGGGCALWKERAWLESILAPQAPDSADPDPTLPVR